MLWKTFVGNKVIVEKLVKLLSKCKFFLKSFSFCAKYMLNVIEKLYGNTIHFDKGEKNSNCMDWCSQIANRSAWALHARNAI